MGGLKVRNLGSRGEVPGRIYESDHLNEKYGLMMLLQQEWNFVHHAMTRVVTIFVTL